VSTDTNGAPFSYLFRKYPGIRFLCWFSAGLLLFIVSFLVHASIRHTPELYSVTPPVGSPGDMVVLDGMYFGDSRVSNFVQIGTERLTSSSYISWTDTQIKLMLPANVQNGLVSVQVAGKKSNPVMFANKTTIPVIVPPNPHTTYPMISSLSAATVSTGQLLTITGSNFGDVRGTSDVYFRTDHANLSTATNSTGQGISPADNWDYIPASADNYDYEYWSDSEIRVRVPDGAVSGNLFVKTEKGSSAFQKITLSTAAGTKKFSSGKTYLIQLSADVSDARIQKDSNAMLTLHVPRPVTLSTQPTVAMTECVPAPVLANYRNTVIHQAPFSQFTDTKKRFRQTFMISVYTLETEVNVRKVAPFSEKKRLLYTANIQSDDCVPASAPQVTQLAKEIIKQEKNPYKQAQLVYKFFLSQYTLLSRVRTGDVSPLDLISSKQGDAYDFAVIYTAVLRSLKIPAKPVSGIVVDSQLQPHTHWWCEFYIENFGWVPVDPAMGSGLQYIQFQQVADPAEFYFGSIDSRHVAFSDSWNNIKPALVSNKTVHRPRSYALQSIWEESTAGADEYSSYWNDPTIIGVY